MRFSQSTQYRIAATCAGVTAALLVGALVYGVVHKGPDGDAGVPEFSPLARALDTAVPADFAYVGWTATHVRVDGKCLNVVVADNAEERTTGLRGASAMGPYDGMLFVFPEEGTSPFTMSGTIEPIDITWFTVEGTPVDHVHMTPCTGTDATCPRYESDKPYRLALERFDGPTTGAMTTC